MVHRMLDVHLQALKFILDEDIVISPGGGCIVRNHRHFGLVEGLFMSMIVRAMVVTQYNTVILPYLDKGML